jgi:hypothetical protein
MHSNLVRNAFLTYCTASGQEVVGPEFGYPVAYDVEQKAIMTNSKDTINPAHYQQGAIQCIEALESATIGKSGIEAVCTANIIKYLWRYEAKGGVEDVRKARWYLEHLVAVLEEREEGGDSVQA